MVAGFFQRVALSYPSANATPGAAATTRPSPATGAIAGITRRRPLNVELPVT